MTGFEQTDSRSPIQAQGLGHQFGFGPAVFSNIDLKIETGEFVTLLGPSGCGKSTLLRLLGGLQVPSQGKLQVQDLKKSFVFQDARLLPWRSCLENTMLPFETSKAANSGLDPQSRAQQVLTSLGLSNDFAKFPHELSGGMKMRCALARGLVLDPDLLLMDEPFAALDEYTRLRLQTDLRQLFEMKKRTIVFVTHSIEEACFLSDRIFLFPKNRQGLRQHRSSLPSKRSNSLREEISFFEEVSKVRRLFQAEVLE